MGPRSRCTFSSPPPLLFGFGAQHLASLQVHTVCLGVCMCHFVFSFWQRRLNYVGSGPNPFPVGTMTLCLACRLVKEHVEDGGEKLGEGLIWVMMSATPLLFFFFLDVRDQVCTEITKLELDV